MGTVKAMHIFVISLVGLGACKWGVIIEEQPVEYDSSPLIHMLCDVSLEEFEAAVRAHPEWINQKSKHLPDRANHSALTAALILGKTNHVRVLIRHGADVREALRWCKQYEFPEGAQLIESLSKEGDLDMGTAPVATTGGEH